jgi:hypothetical protein
MEIKYAYNKQLTIFSDKEGFCENFLPTDVFQELALL